MKTYFYLYQKGFAGVAGHCFLRLPLLYQITPPQDAACLQPRDQLMIQQPRPLHTYNMAARTNLTASIKEIAKCAHLPPLSCSHSPRFTFTKSFDSVYMCQDPEKIAVEAAFHRFSTEIRICTDIHVQQGV